MKPAALLASMLLMAACGSGTHPTGAVSSPSASASATVQPAASPSPAPGVMCSASSRCLALVTLRGSNDIVVRDVTDVNHPTTVATYQHDQPQFVNATTLSYVNPGNGLYRSPVS